MSAAREQFAARNCAILVVSQAQPQWLAHYIARYNWNVPLVCDPARTAYAAFGLERTRWLTFFSPRVLWGYFRGMFKGYGVKRPYAGEDLQQLGGDFILSRSARIEYAYRSADPTDRPSVTDLLSRVPLGTPIEGERAPNAR